MLFRTHILFGVLIFFLAQNLFSFSKTILFISIVIGAIIVDIDSGKSRIGKKLAFKPVRFLVKHRGFFHSLAAAVFLSFLVFLISRDFSIGFFIGYVSHLLLDATTKSGVSFFWPFYKRKGLFIKTGGLIEDVIFLAILVADIHFFLKVYVGIM